MKCKANHCDNKPMVSYPYCRKCYKKATASMKGPVYEEIQSLYKEKLRIQKEWEESCPKVIDISKVVTKYGDKREKKNLSCFIDGCTEKTNAYGICKRHYNYYDNHNKEQLEILRLAALENKPTVCTHPGCKKDVFKTDKCSVHYEKYRIEKYDDVRLNKRRINLKAKGKAPNPNEYVLKEEKNDFIQKTLTKDHLIINTNAYHLALLMGIQDIQWVLRAIETLESEGTLQYKLNLYNHNLTLTFDRLYELKDMLQKLSKPPGIIETPACWRERDVNEPARNAKRKDKNKD